MSSSPAHDLSQFVASPYDPGPVEPIPPHQHLSTLALLIPRHARMTEIGVALNRSLACLEGVVRMDVVGVVVYNVLEVARRLTARLLR